MKKNKGLGKDYSEDDLYKTLTHIVNQLKYVRDYSDDELDTDRMRFIVKGYDEGWFEDDDEDDKRDEDLETLAIMIEQFIRWGSIVNTSERLTEFNPTQS